jgi:hypothetical protein
MDFSCCSSSYIVTGQHWQRGDVELGSVQRQGSLQFGVTHILMINKNGFRPVSRKQHSDIIETTLNAEEICNSVHEFKKKT